MDPSNTHVGEGLKASSTPQMKLRWLHSQIVGGAAEFTSPFGRRRIMYADTTASGQSLLYIENYILRHVLPFYGNTHTSDSYVGQKTTRMVKEASRYIKSRLGGGENDAVLMCGSGSTAAIKRLQEVMGIAVPAMLRDRVLETVLRTEERWLVFVGPYEHHSNLLSWRRSLAEVVEIGMTQDGLVDMEELEGQLERYKDDNRPMMGSFSACSNVTGIGSDTREIASLLHRYGAFACFDFAASAPHVEMDMKSGEMEGYDAMFMSPHKFVGGPGSPGILLMNKALYRINSNCPSTCGGGTVLYVNGLSEKDTIYHEDVEERENAGTPPITQTIRAAMAFWVKEYIGHTFIHTTELNYIQTALTRFSQNTNIKILGNTTVPRHAILSFLIYPIPNNLKPLHGPFVAKLLNDLFGIQARGGCACAGPYAHSLLNVDTKSSLVLRSYIQQGYHGVKPGWTRISFPFYLTKEEFEFILEAIEFVAKYGHMFLPLYRLDLKSGTWSFDSDAWASQVMNTYFKSNKDHNVKNGKVMPFEIDWASDAFKDINLKVGKPNVNKEEEGEKCETKIRVMYKEIAMYLTTLLPTFPKQHPQLHGDDHENIDLLFMV